MKFNERVSDAGKGLDGLRAEVTIEVETLGADLSTGLSATEHIARAVHEEIEEFAEGQP